ncbi:MAG: PmeII family type II restriction endonuclease [Bacteroidota bacterium]
MKKLNLTEVTDYVEAHIGTFHQKRIERLSNLKLKTVLKRKNPYLFRAKHLITAEEIVKGITDAFISSNEETLFGDWLEGLAIFINRKVYSGWKSGIPNIDLEFDKEGVRYIVNIKSGPNWGNSSQIKKMRSDFKTAKKTLRTGNSKLVVTAVNGCCYGIENNPDKGDYFKYCGQQFWEFISRESDLYYKIIESLGHKAGDKNEEFEAAYIKTIGKFTQDFMDDFCTSKGEIDWQKFVEFNSGTK